MHVIAITLLHAIGYSAFGAHVNGVLARRCESVAGSSRRERSDDARDARRRAACHAGPARGGTHRPLRCAALGDEHAERGRATGTRDRHGVRRARGHRSHQRRIVDPASRAPRSGTAASGSTGDRRAANLRLRRDDFGTFNDGAVPAMRARTTAPKDGARDLAQQRAAEFADRDEAIAPGIPLNHDAGDGRIDTTLRNVREVVHAGGAREPA